MNDQAKGHLVKAKAHLAKGDSWYHKAAVEIIAAQKADPTLTNVEIGKQFGRSENWVRKIVTWGTNPTAPSPFAEPDRDTPDVRGAKRVLAEAPLEQVENMLSGVSVQRRAALATSLVAQGDVAEAIHADPEASKVHLRMTDEIVGQATRRSVERGRNESRTIRDIEASRHFSDAAKEMADGNAIVFAHSPEGEALDRCDAAVARVKQYVEQYEEIRGLVLG